MTAPKARIQILSKWPVAGRVKTRLAISADLAAEMQRALLKYLCAEAGKVDSDFQLWLDEIPGSSPDFHCRHLRLQKHGDLGERMAHTADRALMQGRASLLIGSDCPALDSVYLQKACHALAENEFVLAPARDGGYALLGLRHPLPALFENMPWSRPQVAAITLERLAQVGARYQLLDEVRDIDELSDLRTFLKHPHATAILDEALYRKLLEAL